MKIRNGLFAALVAAGVMAVTAPAWACEYGRPAAHAGPDADALAPSRPGAEGAEAEVIATPMTPDLPGRNTVVEGQVAAVDHRSGRMILDTDFGLLHVRAEPAELEGVEEGDVIQVALTD